jgi:hypothetical protein
MSIARILTSAAADPKKYHLFSDILDICWSRGQNWRLQKDKTAAKNDDMIDADCLE